MKFNKKIKIGNLAAFMAISYLFLPTLSGCTDNRVKKDLDQMLVKYGAEDATIDKAEWDEINNYINRFKRYFKDIAPDGTIDRNTLKTYITDFFHHSRPSTDITFRGLEGLVKFNFYLERSGSMIPYDAPQGDGTFKSAIVEMLNNLPDAQDSNKIYVVNNDITPYPKGFKQFLSDNNIFESTKGLGDPGYTDFGSIFDQILNKTDQNHISILVSDLIYSTKSMSGVNPEKIFAEIKGWTSAVFKSATKDKSILLIKMTGSYNGPYYPYNNPTNGVAYNGKRPYYIVVVGSTENIKSLAKDKEFHAFSQWQQLKGFQSEYLFAASGVYSPHYTLLLDHKDIRGRFQPERGQTVQITSIKNVQNDKDAGDVQLVLAVDLNKMFIDTEVMTDASNYEILSEDEIQIKEIRPLKNGDVTPSDQKYVDNATHLFVIDAPKGINNNGDIILRLKNPFPQWVERSSSDSDLNVNAPDFSTTTFGLKYMMHGIYEAYNKNNTTSPYFFELAIKLKK